LRQATDLDIPKEAKPVNINLSSITKGWLEPASNQRGGLILKTFLGNEEIVPQQKKRVGASFVFFNTS
jgi:hypothetical protein